MEQILLNFFNNHGGNSGLVLFLAITSAALLKYVLPPLPGDLAILLASFYLVLHNSHLFPIIIGITAGGTAGAVIVYFMALKESDVCSSNKYFHPCHEKMSAPFRKNAFLFMTFNRFIPGLRPFIFPLAGIYRINLGSVLLAAFAGNLFYGLFIFALALLSSRHFEDIKILYGLLGVWLEFFVLSAVGIAIIWFYRDRIFRFRRKDD